jgi:RNA polymerase sigma factor (sigma-70 family)
VKQLPLGKLSDSQRQAVLAELPALHRFCLSLVRNRADADDLLQATVERLLSKGMPTSAHPAKWIFRVCKNIWLDELRFREVRTRMAHKVVSDPEESPTLEREAAGELQARAVLTAMENLPAEQRLCLSLVALQGKSYKEAAEILDVPVGTIMSRIARARQSLALIFEEKPTSKVSK